MPRRQIVTVVNPTQLGLSLDSSASSRARTKKTKTKTKTKKKKTKTKSAEIGCVTVKRDSKGRFVKKGKRGGGRRRKSSSRKRRSNPAPQVVYVSEPNPKKKKGRRRRRRKNPTIRGAFQYTLNNVLPRMGAKMAMNYAVRKFGSPGGVGIFGQKAVSESQGHGWSFWNYFIAGITGYFGGMLINKYKPGWGRVWADSIYDDMMQRFLWTEIFARWPQTQEMFGSDVVGWQDDGYGNRFAVMSSGTYQPAMLGIEAAGPLDGLVAASPLDGLVAAGPYDDRIPAPVAPMGHYPSPWLGKGAKDPYRAAYM